MRTLLVVKHTFITVVSIPVSVVTTSNRRHT
jgi:hypothetical protein